MRKLVILTSFLVLFISKPVWSHKTSPTKCQTPKLADFTVFTIENIYGQNSDYQGLIGAGGSIELTNFFVGTKLGHCLSLAAGGDIKLKNILLASNIESHQSVNIRSADVRGFIKAGQAVTLSHSKINSFVQSRHKIFLEKAAVRQLIKTQPQFSAPLSAIIQELRDTSNAYSAKSHDPNLRPLLHIKKEDFIELRTKPGFNIVNIDGEKFKQHKQLFVHGGANDQLVLQIQGESVELTDLTVHLTGGIEPHQITWNLAQARYLFIKNTGHPAHGIPGRILAPQARVQFYAGLVAGSIWAYAMDYNHHLGALPSGQVNGDGFNGQQPFE